MSEIRYAAQDYDELSDVVGTFVRQTFPDQTAPAAAAKVAAEAAELVRDPYSSHEAADVLITLLAWCEFRGIEPQRLLRHAFAKMAVNKRRTWAKRPDGTYQHVKRVKCRHEAWDVDSAGQRGHCNDCGEWLGRHE